MANPEGKSCEIGLLIQDAWRKTGIVGLLMGVLIEDARDRGFTVMEGVVPMLRFAQTLGFEVEPGADGATLRISRRLQT